MSDDKSTHEISQADFMQLLAAVEPAAEIAQFENDMPDIRRVNFELQANIRRVDRIVKWLKATFPESEWSDDYGD